MIVELDGYVPAATPGPGYLGFAVPLRLRCAEGELRLVTTLTSFATAVDVTLSELHLEAFLPADHATAEILRHRAGSNARLGTQDRVGDQGQVPLGVNRGHPDDEVAGAGIDVAGDPGGDVGGRADHECLDG